MYNHETGVRQVGRDGKPAVRPAGGKAPCEATIGAPREVRERICPKIDPDSGVELNEANRQAYEHYLECRAVGSFPDDPIVKHNAKVIRQMEDIHAAGKLELAIINSRGK